MDAKPANNDQKFHTLNFTFAEAPAASGTYQLVSMAEGAAGKQFTLSAGYGSIAEAGTPTGDSYVYVYFGDPVDVTVKVTNGKISVSIPEVNVKKVGTGPDVKLKASIKEL
ncbi:hypothetical protein DJ568_07670 [Mucilaginibacter hurinus]|uniref:Uncharacterized protein n=1 Tax=Mucilaginibacter hurinus TaxID=2201324 RepID=A0A367GQM8_9SPHI|nr:hypothetical protein [Mucilaginibacter hurinus]RCH55752.1 hypothetical protein DJ568_07670 [Mucilaginibacter hurinus]